MRPGHQFTAKQAAMFRSNKRKTGVVFKKWHQGNQHADLDSRLWAHLSLPKLGVCPDPGPSAPSSQLTS